MFILSLTTIDVYKRQAYDAFTFRSIPMQHFTDPDGLYQKEFYDNPDFHFPISEDCLYPVSYTHLRASFFRFDKFRIPVISKAGIRFSEYDQPLEDVYKRQELHSMLKHMMIQ